MAADARLVASDSRRLRHLPEHCASIRRSPCCSRSSRRSRRRSPSRTAPRNPLTLANGFSAAPGTTLNTFAVDPDLRVGCSHNWQVLAQRDLPGSLTVTAPYLGTRAAACCRNSCRTHIRSARANPCPRLPSRFCLPGLGWQFDTGTRDSFSCVGGSTAASAHRCNTRFARATDNAARVHGGEYRAGSAIAQDWRDLDAERAPSNFDQRHLVVGTVPVHEPASGIGGGALARRLARSLLTGWTLTTQLSAGSGLPLTPIYLAPVPGSGVTGTIRAAPHWRLDRRAPVAVPQSGRIHHARRRSVGQRRPQLDHAARPRSRSMPAWRASLSAGQPRERSTGGSRRRTC